MAKQSKKVSNKNKIAVSSDRELTQTLLAAFLIVGVILGMGFLGLRLYDNITGFEFTPKDVWQEAFESVESNRVGIVFNSMSTTEDIYDSLRTACNNYIEELNKSNRADTNLNVDVNIDENTYVDKIDKSTQDISASKASEPEKLLANNTSESSLVETGPIYFEDMLMIRYVNYLGELSVITGAYKDGEATVVRQDKLAEYYRDNFNTSNEISNLEDESSDIIEESNKKTISEYEYMEEVANCIKLMLLARNDSDETKAINEALAYFTLDGKDSVISSREVIGITDESRLELAFSICGKSSTSKTVKDRVYLQYKLANGENTEMINIIVKLNSNLRIFDIDIV